MVCRSYIFREPANVSETDTDEALACGCKRARELGRTEPEKWPRSGQAGFLCETQEPPKLLKFDKPYFAPLARSYEGHPS